jgi:hypothetical protein
LKLLPKASLIQTRNKSETELQVIRDGQQVEQEDPESTTPKEGDLKTSSLLIAFVRHRALTDAS